MFSLLPVAKLSRQTTLFPFSSKASHKFDPIKPAPPVTRIVLLLNSIFLYFIKVKVFSVII